MSAPKFEVSIVHHQEVSTKSKNNINTSCPFFLMFFLSLFLSLFLIFNHFQCINKGILERHMNDEKQTEIK